MSLRTKVVDALPFGEPQDQLSMVLRTATAFAASVLLRKLLKVVWEKSSGRNAPTNPSIPGVGWREAILWGVLTGALAGTVKVVARRGTDRLSSR